MSSQPKSTFDNIIEAYIKICSTSGAETITLKNLSKITGLAVSNIKYHIDNNQGDLSIASREKIRNHINVYLEEGQFKDKQNTNFDPLKSYIANMLTWGHKYHNYACYLLYIYYLTSIEKNENGYTEILHKAITRIESLLNEGVGLGLYSVDSKDKVLISKTIHSLVLGQLVITVNLKSKSDLEERIKNTYWLVKMLLKSAK